MGEGIRIKHRTMKNVLLAVRDLTERVEPPYPACSACSIDEPGHEGYKTRHILLDHEGYGLVSEGVLDGLKHLGDMGGFDISNTVANPPEQNVAFNGDGTVSVTAKQYLTPMIGAVS